ncbi:hypothetical protein TWF506_002539 [Arthrobotrys conoides]|uniref:F-box domain-containing protein n=1 Tax=Arthrobotrys conoides TaxID=74498 RepID=A0AAN8P958_9PEZI
MTPIIILAPELLFSIIRHLPSKDTLNLGLSCKALFPVCYQALWSSASLIPARGKKTWPGFQIRRKFVSEVRETIEKSWLGSPGLKYAKHVDFGNLIYKRGEEAPILMQLLEDGVIKPRCIDLSFFTSDLRSMDQRPAIQQMKKYTESKTLKELKTHLYSEIGYSLSEIVDLTKITRLTFNISIEGYRPGTEPEETVSRRIKDITSILEKTIYLKYFSWKGDTDRKYHIDSVSEELEDLQIAFNNLRDLESLRIENYLFHPSFFLKPPETVRSLVLNCLGSGQWWKGFAACPLTNVTDLRFHRAPAVTSYASELRGFFSADEDLSIDTITVEKVAVQSLEVFLCHSNVVPQDLGRHILKGNPKLQRGYKLELTGREAKRLLRKYHSRFEGNWELSKSYFEDLYITHYLNDADPTTELEVVEGFCLMCIMGEIEKGYVHCWDSAKKRADIIGEKCKADLEEKFPGSIDYAIHYYTLEFMKGQDDVDEDEFKKESIRLFGEDAQRERKYAAAKETATKVLPPIVNKFRRIFDALKKTIIKDASEKIFNDLELDEMSVMSSWTEKALEQFRDFGVTKLSLSGVDGD